MSTVHAATGSPFLELPSPREKVNRILKKIRPKNVMRAKDPEGGIFITNSSVATQSARAVSIAGA